MKNLLRSRFTSLSQFISPNFLTKAFLFPSALVFCTSSIVNAQTPAITNVTVTGTVCAGANVTVNFKVVNGNGIPKYFNNLSKYQAYISDASGGNFAVIGSSSSIIAVYPTYNGGSVVVSKTITIPSNTPSGTGYRIAISSVNPDYDCLVEPNASAAFTVNVPVAITIQPQTQTLCLHYPSGIKTTVTGSIPTFSWEVNNGTGWASVVNGPEYSGATTDSLTVLNPRIEMVAYQYRNNVGGACSLPAASSVVNLKMRNVWLGNVNNNWQNAANWSDGVVAGVGCDTVYIPNRPIKPVLSSGNATIKNLVIYPGADLTIANQPSTWLAISGSIVNKNVTPAINALNGRLVLNGTLPQQIWGSLFTQRTLNYLTVSNSVSVLGVPNIDTLYISNRLNFGNVNGKTFTTNDNLTLMSRGMNATASVGDLTNMGTNNSNVISGKVTVERWLNARKAWRFLSIPTISTQTFKTSWQENNLANSNLINPGFGTTITNLTATDNWIAAGFDTYSNGASVKFYNADFVSFCGVPNTLTTQINTSRGYMTFVRGDRSATTYNAAPTSTILRTSGTLKQGNITIPVPASTMVDVGNPYAAAIDMRKITMPNVQSFFYLWNPNLGGSYGLGSFQTYSFDGTDYVPTPNDGSGPINFIQSGQAFLVRGGTCAGSVDFKEADKDSTNNMLFRVSGRPEILTANLSIRANNTQTLVDGAMIEYGDNWSNDVDVDDAVKMANTSENVASFRDNKLLSIERRRTVSETDTIFVRLSALRVADYHWSIALRNMDSMGRTAFLLDSYLNTSTPLALDDTTSYDFNVQNIAGSYAAGRFTIIFKQLQPPTPPTPVTIASISASRIYDNSIAIDWKVAHEANVKAYTIERSEDGNSFGGIITKNASSNTGATVNYNVNDISPLAQDNFYRVRALLVNGQAVYSQIVKVNPLPYVTGITVFPNPVQNKNLHVKFAGQLKGRYTLTMQNQLGQVIQQSSTVVNATITAADIKLNSFFTPGHYQLQIISPNGEVTKQQVIVE